MSQVRLGHLNFTLKLLYKVKRWKIMQMLFHILSVAFKITLYDCVCQNSVSQPWRITSGLQPRYSITPTRIHSVFWQMFCCFFCWRGPLQPLPAFIPFSFHAPWAVFITKRFPLGGFNCTAPCLFSKEDILVLKQQGVSVKVASCHECFCKN